MEEPQLCRTFLQSYCPCLISFIKILTEAQYCRPSVHRFETLKKEIVAEPLFTTVKKNP